MTEKSYTQIDDRLKELYIKYYSQESWDRFIMSDQKKFDTDRNFLLEITKLLKEA